MQHGPQLQVLRFLPVLAIAGALCASAMAQDGKPATEEPATPEVHYDLSELPERVAAMREAILIAAWSGDPEAVVPVLQSNELMPLLADRRVEDPVAFFKESSADGTGHDVLAAMIGVLQTGFVKQEVAGSVTYVWPYFVDYPFEALTPSQWVELHRLVPPSEVTAMKEAGRYLHYSIGIGPDGTWHYFVKEK